MALIQITAFSGLEYFNSLFNALSASNLTSPIIPTTLFAPVAFQPLQNITFLKHYLPYLIALKGFLSSRADVKTPISPISFHNSPNTADSLLSYESQESLGPLTTWCGFIIIGNAHTTTSSPRKLSMALQELAHKSLPPWRSFPEYSVFPQNTEQLSIMFHCDFFFAFVSISPDLSYLRSGNMS